MFYDKNIPLDRTNEEISLNMVKNFNEKKGQCSFNIILDKKIIKEIYDKFLFYNREVGGIMVGKKTKEGYSLEIQKITEGKDFIVSTPVDLINWHVHPFICYTAFDCFLGWPSGLDMGYLFRNYIFGLVSHFLFSVEGIYLIQLNPLIMLLLRFLPKDCIFKISKLIDFNFSILEQFRKIQYDDERLRCLEEIESFECYTYNNLTQHLSIGEIVKQINAFTLQELLEFNDNDLIEIQNIKKEIKENNCLTNAIKLVNNSDLGIKITNLNFSIFGIDFIYTENAKKRGIFKKIDFFITPEQKFCP